jgi:nicotinamidase-related amidase
VPELPLPPHFLPERVAEVWRVPYEERASNAEAWARRHGVRPAADDAFRVCLLVVDCQNTFCTPGFELFVPGAPDDSRRLCEFVYRNLASLTEVAVTLDTHLAFQVFHAAWLVDARGQHPAPYTEVSVADVEAGVWRASDPAEQDELLAYVRALEAGGKYRLTVWPYHAMLGGVGHALVSSVEEAVFFHALARSAPTRFEVKGNDPRTEHYSVLGPEVGGRRNDALIERLRSFDAVAIAGQAKSHCVAWTVSELLAEAPDLTDRLCLLEDCTSPVVVPGAVDFTDEADAAFARFAEAGAHVVRSTEPIEAWLERTTGVRPGSDPRSRP